MKIMQICFTPIVDSAGGAEKVFCNMANHFCEKHDVVNVCCDNKVGVPFYELNKNVKFVNLAGENLIVVPIYVKILSELMRIGKKLGADVELAKDRYFNKIVCEKLKALVSDLNPDIIICYDMRAVKALKSIEFPCGKIIVMFHSDVNIVINSISKNIEEYLKTVKAVQVLLGSGKKFLENRGFKNVVCIGNIVHASHINHEIEREKVIIHVGRLDKKVKRQHLAVEAFAKIAKEYPEWKLKLIGGDSVPQNYLDDMRDYIEKQGLNDRVIFTGKISDVYSELAKASIFVFPSLYEGFGMSLCEAMSAGLPVIGFKYALGVNEIVINDKNGILCQDKVESLAEALKKLIENDNLRACYGDCGRKFIDKFNEKIIYAKWDKLVI